MNYFLINSNIQIFAEDALDIPVTCSPYQKWIEKGIIATQGADRYGKKLAPINAGDIIVGYESKIGVFGIARALEAWDGKTHPRSIIFNIIFPEYRIRVHWFINWSKRILSPQEAKEKFNLPPLRHSVCQIHDKRSISLISSFIKDYAPLDYFEEIQKKLDSYDELDQERAIHVRREQSFLRQFLFRKNEKGTCMICGSEFPVSLLVAAHIKPRSKCSNEEKLDYANNVVPMCLLGCDALFERGLIVVQEGKVHVRLLDKMNDKRDQFLRQIEGRPTPAWKSGRPKYFNWHAKHAAPSIP